MGDVRWEYYQITRERSHATPDWDEMQALGDDGWEMFMAEHCPGFTAWWFKRRLPTQQDNPDG